MDDGPATDRAPEAVLFDLDDTLCAYRRPGEELFAAVGVEPFFAVEEYDGRYDEFAAVATAVAEVRERCFATVAAERGRDPAVGREVAAACAAERDHADVRPLPGVVRRLAADGYRVGLVTNGPPEVQRVKLGVLGLTDAFGTTRPPSPTPSRFAPRSTRSACRRRRPSTSAPRRRRTWRGPPTPAWGRCSSGGSTTRRPTSGCRRWRRSTRRRG